MKIEYKNIIGIPGKDSYSCFDCCFYNLKNCIPHHIHICHNIFKEERTQIFNL